MAATTKMVPPLSLDSAPMDAIEDLVPLLGTVQRWFLTHWLEVLLAIAAGIAIYAMLTYLKRRAQRYVEKHSGLLGYAAIVSRAIARTRRFFRALIAAELVAGFTEPPLAVAHSITFLFTIAMVIQVAVWAREILIGLIEIRAKREGEHNETLENALTLIRILVTVVVFAIALIVILDNLGVNVTGLVAGLGIGGIAIGLAAQGIFSELFAALAIIFDQPFKRGETITFDTMTATVERIGLKSTRLRALTGEEVIMSNSKLLEKQIINISRLERRRTRFTIGLTYHSDAAKARAVPDMLQALVEERGYQFIRAGFIGFGPSSIDFELDFDIMSDDFNIVFAGRHDVGLAIWEKFREEGLEFAYPTQTTYTAAPDGTLIMPYAPHATPSAA